MQLVETAICLAQIVQEQPDALAQVISGVLDTVQPISSKL
jgi:hypothetical protein